MRELHPARVDADLRRCGAHDLVQRGICIQRSQTTFFSPPERTLVGRVVVLLPPPVSSDIPGATSTRPTASLPAERQHDDALGR